MRQILLSGLVVSIALFIGRMSGFFREVFVANIFGVSSRSDLVIVFLTIPDILVNLLVGGALGMVIIPELKRLNDTDGRIFYFQALYFAASVFVLFAVFSSYFSTELLQFFAPGIDYATAEEVSTFLKLSLLAIPLTVVSGITAAYLNHKGKFFIPAMGTFVFNVVIVAFLAISFKADEQYFFYYLSLGICCAAFVRWLSFIANDGFGFGVKNFFSVNTLNLELAKKYFYCVLASGFLFLIPVIIRAFASELGPGELSLANYSLKLVDFPLAVFLTVFSVVFLSKLSHLYAEKNETSFNQLFWSACALLFFISTIITFCVVSFPNQITSLVYNWGGVTENDIFKISGLVSVAIFSLIFQALISFLISAHAARHDTFTPFMVSIGAVLIFTVTTKIADLDLVSMFYLMNLCYLLIGVLLIFNIRLKHRVLNSFFRFVRVIKMITVLWFSFLILNYFSSLNLNIFAVLAVCFFVSLLSIVAWLIIDRDLRLLVKSNE